MDHKVLRFYFHEENRPEIQRFVDIFVNKFDKKELRIITKAVNDNEKSQDISNRLYYEVDDVNLGWVNAVITDSAGGQINSLKGRIEESFFVELFVKVKEVLRHNIVDDFDFVLPKYREAAIHWLSKGKCSFVDGLQVVFNETYNRILGLTLTLPEGTLNMVQCEKIFFQGAVKNELFRLNKGKRYFVVYGVKFGDETIYSVHTFVDRHFLQNGAIYYSDLDICALENKIVLFQEFMVCLFQRYCKGLQNSKELLLKSQQFLQNLKG